MNKLYSILTVKAVDEDKRIIRGIASTPSTDRVGDIVESKGAQYKLPIPLLWQHRSDDPVGQVKVVKITDEGIEIEAHIQKYDTPGALKDLLDKAWGMVKTELVKGLSIGFAPIETADIKGSFGTRYLKWDWLELSLVTIPANAQATIQTVKSLATASGGVVKSPGVAGKTTKVNKMDIGEQIKSFEATRQAKSARMAEIMEKSGAEGTTLDAEQTEEYDGLDVELKAIDAHLVRLRNMEKRNLELAKQIPAVITSVIGSEARDHVTVKNTQKLEPGIEFARYAMCKLAAGKNNPGMAVNLAMKHYPEMERVVKALRFQAEGGNLSNVMKAVVDAGTTLDATWAGPLVDYQAFAGDFVEFLRPQTIIGQFGTNGIPALNRIPFNVRIAGQTSGGDAYWVGEGKPKPLTAFDFNATELRWAKVAAISVLTNELIRFSNPSAERLVRDSLAAAVIGRIDTDFIDPLKAAVSNVSPASITNGVTPILSTGDDADAIRCDLQALWAPFIAARNPPRTAVYIMDSTTALALSLMLNALGQKEFPGITMNGGVFNGVPVIVSDYAPVDTTGSIVVLVNARDIWLADDGQVTIDASGETSLQMLDNPTNASDNGTATSMVSMFQTDSTAFRAERFINWAKRRSSAVSFLEGVNWGACAS